MAASELTHTGGRRLFNQIFNGQTSRPATLYVLLRTLDGVGGHPADAAAADTLLSNLAEVTAAGYARQSFTNNSATFVESLSGADSRLTSPAVTFSFTATQNGVTHSALATSPDNTGTLISSAPLAVTRNFATGDTEQVTYTATMTTA